MTGGEENWSYSYDTNISTNFETSSSLGLFAVWDDAPAMAQKAQFRTSYLQSNILGSDFQFNDLEASLTALANKRNIRVSTVRFGTPCPQSQNRWDRYMLLCSIEEAV